MKMNSSKINLDRYKRIFDDKFKEIKASSAERSRDLQIFEVAGRKLFEENNPYFLLALTRLKRIPVTIQEFLESNEFLNGVCEVWDKLKPDVYKMNPDIFLGQPQMNEIILAGATGWGKTEAAQITQLYQLYLFTCFDTPQLLYGLNKQTQIVFAFQSVEEGVTRRAIFTPFRQKFEDMMYVKKWVKYNRNLDTRLEIEGNLIVVPALARLQKTIGQAIASSIIDEANFMSIIEESKLATPGTISKYDQAEEVYRNISRRRKSRFNFLGPVPGCVCVMSSTRYKDDFLDRRIKQIETNKEKGVLAIRRTQYETQPTSRFCGDKFRLIVGSETYPTRVVEEPEVKGVDFPEDCYVEEVPVEYKNEFLNDPENSLRDILGISTYAISPFFTQRHKINEAFLLSSSKNIKNFVGKSEYMLSEVVDLLKDGMPQIVEANLPEDRESQRFIHIDLSLTNDACGIAMCKLDGFTEVKSESTNMTNFMPKVIVEMAFGIKPSKAKQLDITEVRNWVVQLKTFYKFNIVAVTYDGFQSAESIQLIRKSGIRSDIVSVDRDMEAYNNLKNLFYQNRLAIVKNDYLKNELVSLEYNSRKEKVDHTPRSTKDISDAVAACCWVACNVRSTTSQISTKLS